MKELDSITIEVAEMFPFPLTPKWNVVGISNSNNQSKNTTKFKNFLKILGVPELFP